MSVSLFSSFCYLWHSHPTKHTDRRRKKWCHLSTHSKWRNSWKASESLLRVGRHAGVLHLRGTVTCQIAPASIADLKRARSLQFESTGEPRNKFNVTFEMWCPDCSCLTEAIMWIFHNDVGIDCFYLSYWSITRNAWNLTRALNTATDIHRMASCSMFLILKYAFFQVRGTPVKARCFLQSDI